MAYSAFTAIFRSFYKGLMINIITTLILVQFLLIDFIHFMKLEITIKAKIS